MRHRRKAFIRVLGMVPVAALLSAGFLPAPASAATASVSLVRSAGSTVTTTAEAVSIPASALSNTIEPQASSSASGVPFYPISNSGGLLAGIHQCVAISKNDKTNQGVFCADLYAMPDPNDPDGVIVAPIGEGMCQGLANKKSFPQCANVLAKLTINVISQHNITGTQIVQCGHAAGPCMSGGRNLLIAPIGLGIHGCDTAAGGDNEVWNVIQHDSSVELPGSALLVETTSDLGSGHAIVCRV
jgi:hypothetical protein